MAYSPGTRKEVYLGYNPGTRREVYPGVYASIPWWEVYPGVYAHYTTLGTPILYTLSVMVNVPVDTLSAVRRPWALKGRNPWVRASL